MIYKRLMRFLGIRRRFEPLTRQRWWNKVKQKVVVFFFEFFSRTCLSCLQRIIHQLIQSFVKVI